MNSNKKNSFFSAMLVSLLAFCFCFSCSGNDDDGNGGGSGNSGGYERSEYYKYYNPDDKSQKCENGVVEMKCPSETEDGVWYNPITHYCEGDWRSNKATYPGVPSVKLWTCGNRRLDFERCRDGVVESYNFDGWHPLSRCGNEYYDPRYGEAECQKGILMRKCSGDWYNTKTQYCDYDNDKKGTIKTKPRCGNEYYDPEWQGCQNGVLGEKCPEKEDGLWYNPITHDCEIHWEETPYTFTIKEKQRCAEPTPP
jgi:hypothetical protein